MCNPLLALAAPPAVLGVGQAVASYAGQKQAYASNATAANLNFARQSDIINQKATQLNQERSEKAFDTAIVAARSRGRINAALSDRGLAPGSIVTQLNADMFGLGRQVSMEEANDRNARAQLGNELAGAEVSRSNQINSMAKPSKLSLILGIGQGVMSGVSTYSSLGGRIPGVRG
jgi:hypothetical protein